MSQPHRRGEIHVYRTKGGTCRICREPIVEDGVPNLRKTWHPGCLETYWLQTNAGETRRIVFKRDAGVCRDCSATDPYFRGDWAADHVVPLIDGGGFGLDNLQTLCTACHARKTAREAGERAARRATVRRFQQMDALPNLLFGQTSE